MAKRVALVGHCGPDSSYLRLTVSRADKDVSVIAADDEQGLQRTLREGVDLLLLNRQLDWGFEEQLGQDLVKRLRASHPGVKAMLVSNYADAQAAAVANGALPGFGKRDLGTPRVAQMIREALGAEVPQQKG